jgi:Sec-independent protein translocase protein TatA
MTIHGISSKIVFSCWLGSLLLPLSLLHAQPVVQPIGIREGLALRDYTDNNAMRQEEAKLKAQLYKSQAERLDAETKLMQKQLEVLQQRQPTPENFLTREEQFCKAQGKQAEGVAKLRDVGMSLTDTLGYLRQGMKRTSDSEIQELESAHLTKAARAIYANPTVSPVQVRNAFEVECLKGETAPPRPLY